MGRRRRLVLVANPAASQFTGGMHRDVLARLRSVFDVTAEWPGSAEAVTDVAANAASEGVDVVVAMGGDGVVNRVVNGIATTTTALGIIPVGTTNVLAAILGVDPDPRKAALQLASINHPKPVSLAKVTIDDKTSRYVTFALGAGFDAEVVDQAEQAPHKKMFLGGAYYAQTTAKVLITRFRSRPPTLRVETSEGGFDAVAALVQLHWPYTFFGKVALGLAPQAPEHGFHVAGVDRLALRRIPALALAAFRSASWADTRGGFRALNQDAIVIEADPPTLIQADGDVIGLGSHIVVSTVPDGVLVYA